MSADISVTQHINAGATPRTQSPVEDQLDRMRNTLGRLEAVLDEHAGRLTPVLAPEYKEPKPGGELVDGGSAPLAPVTRNLTEFVAWAQRLADQLQSLTGRLEI